MSETFTDRFNRLTEGYDDSALAEMSGLKYNTVRDIRSGTIKSIKLEAALKLCRRLNLTPWELQGEIEPSTQFELKLPDLSLALGVRMAPTGSELTPDRVRQIENAISSSLNSAFRVDVISRKIPTVSMLPGHAFETELSAPLRAELKDMEDRLLEHLKEFVKLQLPAVTAPAAPRSSESKTRKRASGQ